MLNEVKILNKNFKGRKFVILIKLLLFNFDSEGNIENKILDLFVLKNKIKEEIW